MRTKQIHKLWSLILTIALFMQTVAPILANGQIFMLNKANPLPATQSEILFRAHIKVNSPADWRRLEEWDVIVLESGDNWATVLVHDEQLATLARLRFAPQEINGISTLITAQAKEDASIAVAFDTLLNEAKQMAATVNASEKFIERTPLQTHMLSLSSSQKQILVTLNGVDNDGDGLTDTEEGWWCTDVNAADTDGDGVSDGDEVVQLLANNSADGKPFQGWPPDHTGCFDDDSDSIPDAAEINVIGLNINRESTDGDKFDDGQEFFGITKYPGYGALPRPEDSFITANMPGWVDPPGNSPFVAAYPQISIDIIPDSVSVALVTEITVGESHSEGEIFSYGTTHSEGTAMGTGHEQSHTYGQWQEVSNTVADGYESAQYQSVMESHSREYYSEHSIGRTDTVEQGGSYEVTNGSALGTNASIYGSTSLGTEVSTVVGAAAFPPSVSAEVGASVNASVEVGSEASISAETSHSESYGESWSASSSVSAQSTQGQSVGYEVGYESGTSFAVTHVEERGTAVGVGYESTQSTLITSETYEEVAVSNENSIATQQEWSTATAINTSHAADLTFTYRVANSGTDNARSISNLIFNIYIGNSEFPITYSALNNIRAVAGRAPLNGELTNFYPDEEHIYTSSAISLSLEQLKEIDNGSPIRVVLEDFSYGDDEQFYQNAWGYGVLLEVDDGTWDGNKELDHYLVPTWGQETYQDVIKRYFPATETEAGDILSVSTPEYDTNGEITEWNNYAIGGKSWWNVYLQEPTGNYFVPFREKLATPETHLLLRFNRDSDSDHYSDRAEREIGTDLSDQGDHPSAALVAGYYTVREGDSVQVQLALHNFGNYPAYGIHASMFSPDTTTTVEGGLVGMAGRIEVGDKVMLSSNIAPADPISWSSYAQPLAGGHYELDHDNVYTFTVNMNGGVGTTTGLELGWINTDGDSGTVNVGNGYVNLTAVTVADGLVVGMGSGNLVAGEQFCVAAYAPRDVFTYQINQEPYTPPIIIGSYNDAEGNHTFVVPVELNHVTDDLFPYVDQMQAAPEMAVLSDNVFDDSSDNQLLISVINPFDSSIYDVKLGIAFATVTGTVVANGLIETDLLPGPNMLTHVWNTDTFIPAFDVMMQYKVKVYVVDHNHVPLTSDSEQFFEMGSKAQPQLALADATIDLGTIRQGLTVIDSIDIANTGLDELWVWAGVGSPLPLRSQATITQLSPSEFAQVSLAIDTTQFSAGAFSEQVELRTNDPAQPTVAVTITGIIETVTGAEAYNNDANYPLEEIVSVLGSYSANEVLSYDTALNLSSDTYPVWLRDNGAVIGHGNHAPSLNSQNPLNMPLSIEEDQPFSDKIDLEALNTPNARFYQQDDGTIIAYVLLTDDGQQRAPESNASVSADCYVASWPSSTAQCGQTHFYVGFNDYYGKGQTRAYLNFNLPSRPSGTYVQNAKLRMYSYSWQGSNSFRADVYRVNSGWSSPTWNNQPCGSCVYIGNTTVNKSAGYYYWPITSMAKNWYNGTANYGLMVRANNENEYGSVFYSKESSNPPILEITFASLGTPTISNISNSDGNGSYNVCWSSSSGASSYQLQEKIGSGSWSTIYSGSSTCSGRSGRSAGQWSYHVKGVNGSNSGNWSGTKSVWVKPTSAPTVSTPSGDSNGSYTVNWTSVAGATIYELQEQFNSGGWSTIHNGSGTSKSRSSRTAGTWCYRARGENTGGDGPWGAIKCTIVAPSTAPELNPIDNSDGSGDYTATWSATTGATSYELQEQYDSGGWATVYTGSGTNRALTGHTSGNWCYHVRASNTGGATIWSNVECTLVNTAPNLPINLTPVGDSGSLGRYLTFSWQDGGDSDNAPNTYRQFRVRIEDTATGWVDTTSWTQDLSQIVSLPNDGIYQWKVEAYDGLETSGWTTARTIQVYSLEKLGDYTVSIALPTDIAGIATYQVQYGVVAEFASANQPQIVSLILPKRVYQAVTLDMYLPVENTSFGLDIGNDGQHVWSDSGNGATFVESPDLADAINAYLATQTIAWGEMVSIPIAVSADAIGTVILTDVLIAFQAESDPAIENMTVSNLSPSEGDMVSVSAEIYNNGSNAAENIIVSFYTGNPTLGGGLIGSDFIATLPSGGNDTTSVLWDTSGHTGDINLYAVVDFQGQLSELDETNNRNNLTVHIRTLPDLQVIDISPATAARKNQLGDLLITIHNVGETDAAQHTVSLYEGATLLGTQTVTVTASQTATVALPYTPSVLGDNMVRAIVDSLDEVLEYDEANNALDAIVYAGWGAPAMIDAGDTSEPSYDNTAGYGYLNGNPVTCGEETYREAGSTEQLQYRFDYLHPDRFYHLDLSFFLCNGNRDLRILVDGVEIANGITASEAPSAHSLLIDPAFYIDNSLTIAIEKISGGLGGPVVSALALIDIRYCYRDSGHPAEAAFATSPDSCGWLDGTADQSWGTQPHQSVRYNNSDALHYQFAQLNPTLKYQLNLTFFEGDNASRVEHASIDGVSVLTDISLNDTPTIATVIVPASTYGDGEIILSIMEAEQPVISEIALEQMTLAEDPAATTTLSQSIEVGWQLISLALIAPDTPITDALSSIAGSYDLVYAYDAATGVWLRYAPDGPPFGNTLSTVNPTTGLWLRGTTSATLTTSGMYPTAVDIPLATGWNLISLPIYGNMPIADALASIAGSYDLVYGYASGAWLRYAPDGPPFGNTLSIVAAGEAYWIRAIEPATLAISN